MKTISIRIKIISLTAFILLTAGVGIVFFVYSSTKSGLIEATDRSVRLNTETLFISLQNMMVSGEAPVLVRTMKDLRALKEYQHVVIYRINGDLAFSDYATLDDVNKRLETEQFFQTPRITPDTSEHLMSVGRVREAIGKGSSMRYMRENGRIIDYFTPIENLPECRLCHGSESGYRGVAQFSISIDDVYRQISRVRNVLFIFFGIVGIVLISLLVVMIRSVIIKPVIQIGETVREIGSGNFRERVTLVRGDEIGDLGRAINEMAKGLDERFRLMKYVSSSTASAIGEAVEKGDEHAGIERKNIAVLFTDIRGFTSFSENHPSDKVISVLNSVLEVQAEAVHEFGGDIDKFVGDAVMALFAEPLSAVRCAFEMIRRVNDLSAGGDDPLHIGAGINLGEVILGNIGSSNRLEYAAIGDTVNVASRLCSKAPPDTVLVSAEFFRAVEPYVSSALIRGQTIKGKKEQIDIYRIITVS